MKANELRLGNIIKSKSSATFWSVDIDDLILINDNPNHYLPIPLTEEWLLKFGFKLIRRANYINCDFDEWSLGEFELEDFIYRGSVEKELKHVHQLQNLYFALTGEELILK